MGEAGWLAEGWGLREGEVCFNRRRFGLTLCISYLFHLLHRSSDFWSCMKCRGSFEDARAVTEQCQQLRGIPSPCKSWLACGGNTSFDSRERELLQVYKYLGFLTSSCLFIPQVFFLVCSHSLHSLCWTDSQGVAFLQLQCCNSSEMLVTVLSVLKCSQDNPFKRTVTHTL